MIITKNSEWEGMQQVSDAVAQTLKAMKDFAQAGMSTKELDDFGARLLKEYGANSAPYETYKFPGFTCISVGKEFCHGIPSNKRILQEGDLINIDVSAELNGFWSDNGASFIIGEDKNNHQKLVNASKEILRKAISQIKTGVRISDVGYVMETEAKLLGFTVIRNLCGHGVGRSLHEEPNGITNYKYYLNLDRFKKNSVVAIETFIATHSSRAITTRDGWTMVGNKGGYMAQHEHTVVVTDDEPIILTSKNDIWSEVS